MINYLSAYPLIGVFVDVTTVMIAVAIIINLVNVARGFIIANRIIALDALGNQVMALMILYAFKHGTDHYMSGVLVICILSFVSLIVWSKYLQRGNIVYPLSKTAAKKVSLSQLNAHSSQAAEEAEEIQEEKDAAALETAEAEAVAEEEVSHE